MEKEKKKTTKTIIIILVILAGLAAVAFFAMKKGLLDFNGDELKIDETATVVTEIKKISEFTSACFYEEIILQETKAADNVTNKVVGFFGKKEAVITDEIVIIANGKVRAGFNLKDLADNDIMVNGDTLQVSLPKAEIFDVIVNPSDFDIYIEDGTWDEQKVVEIKNKAITKIKEDAINEGILEKAQESGVKKLTEMFKTFGYEEVIVMVKE